MRREAEIPFGIEMIPKGGLEPPRVSPPAFKVRRPGQQSSPLRED
jgi:hypothetical protein